MDAKVERTLGGAEGQPSAPVVGRAVIPFVALTPGACDLVAETTEQAMDVFARWSIPPPKQARLRGAVVLLRKVAATASWGTTRAELATAAAALAIVGEPGGLVPTFTAWVTTYVMERGCNGIIQESVHGLFRSLKSAIQEFGDLPIRQLSPKR